MSSSLTTSVSFPYHFLPLPLFLASFCNIGVAQG